MREPNARERRRLQQIAFHQAGHAVAAHALGVAFDGVSVFPDEFERGEHLPLSSPGIGADVHIRILLAGDESCLRFDPARLWSERDGRRDGAQIRDLAKGLASNKDERWAHLHALRDRAAKLFARPANQAAVGALATALLANGRLEGQHAREIIREAGRAARSGQADGPLVPSAAVPAVLPDLVSAVRARNRRNGSSMRAELRRLIGRVGPWEQLFQGAERADVPEAWRGGTNPKYVYFKKCLDKSWSYVLQHGGPPDLADGMRLVLGLVSFPSRRSFPIRHAWVELPNEVVFDGVVQAFFTRESYYRVMGVEAQQSFTRAETIQQIIEKSDFGFHDPQYNDFEALAAYMRRFGLTLRYGDGCPVQEPAPPD